MFVPTPEQLSARAVAAVDTDRLIELVQQVCRIPSVLGEEGELAGFLHSVMAASGFEAAGLQPVLPGRPNALGEMSFGPGPRVVAHRAPGHQAGVARLDRGIPLFGCAG